MRSQRLRVLAAVACGAALATPQMTASQEFADVEIQTIAVATRTSGTACGWVSR
jgi:hypothetical protein